MPETLGRPCAAAGLLQDRTGRCHAWKDV